jgi:hypothetical protein
MEPSLVGSFRHRVAVVLSGRCHCAVCLAVRIREGHCRDCRSNRRVIEAIAVG